MAATKTVVYFSFEWMAQNILESRLITEVV